MRIVDITGKRFGKLVTIELLNHRSSAGACIWKCKCDCGSIVEVSRGDLRRVKSTKSCGCSRITDIAGKRFGKLVAIELLDKKRSGTSRVWKCKCDCGSAVEVSSKNLRCGNTTSCGCLRATRYKSLNGKLWWQIRHGAKLRDLSFEITIVQAYDLLMKQEGLCALSGKKISFEDGTASLDRIDSKKGYTTDNIQWVHKDINRMKFDLEEEYFIRLCVDVAKTQKIKE